MKFTVRRLMISVAILAVFLAGSISAYRWAVREICLAEIGYFRDRETRASSPGLKAENADRAAYYERRWRSYGGGP